MRIDFLESRKSARLIGLAVLLCWAGNAWAAPVEEPLSLEQVLARAFESSPELAAAGWQTSIADAQRRQAGLSPNPELSWEVEDTRWDRATTTITLSQPLELGGKRGARIGLAEVEQASSTLAVQQYRNRLRAEVTAAFQAVLRAQTGLELAQQTEGLLEQGLRVVEGRVRAGKSSPVEVTRAQVQLTQTRLQLGRAQVQLQEARRDLQTLIGNDPRPLGPLQAAAQTPGAVPDSERLLAQLEQTPDWRLAEVQIEQQEARLGLEKRQRIPDLTISLGSQYDRDSRERANVVGFSLPLPLFDRNQGAILAAARGADQARDLRNAQALALRSQVQSSLSQWQQGLEEAKGFEQAVLPAAREAVRNATRGFEMGKFGFTEVLDAQRTLIEARQQYLEALAYASQARLQVERIYGDLQPFTP